MSAPVFLPVSPLQTLSRSLRPICITCALAALPATVGADEDRSTFFLHAAPAAGQAPDIASAVAAATEVTRLREEEAARVAAAALAARLAAELEAARLAAEAEAARIAAEARARAEEEARRFAELEAIRLAAEARAARLAAEARAEALAAAEAAALAARLAAEAEAQRLAELEAARIAALVAQCAETAGTPSADVPVSEAAQRAVFDRLRAAFATCQEAVDADPEAGVPLFHLATVAQARGQHREALDLYTRAAEAGVVPAHTRIGDYFNFAIGPIRTDLDRAVAAYETATDMGDRAGMATLAFMYRLGRGVTRDPARAVALFEQAADKGYHFAQVNLAETYLTGEGFPNNTAADLGIPDGQVALPLLAAASEAGNLAAATRLAEIYRDGAVNVPADADQWFNWTNRLAEMGQPEAIAARAWMTEQGISVLPDPRAAALGYVAALETGEVRPEALRAAGGPGGPGWERQTAIEFQLILQERGLYQGPIDGIVGGGTLGAAAGLAP